MPVEGTAPVNIAIETVTVEATHFFEAQIIILLKSIQ